LLLKNKRSPLHYAAAFTTSDGGKIYKMLIKAGATTDIEDAVKYITFWD